MRRWVLSGALVLSACGSAEGGDNGNNNPSDATTAGDSGFNLDGTTACVNLECRQVTCDAGGKTTISGTVHDPAGKVALYNVVVYVPNAAVEPFTDGASCDRCGNVSGSPLVSAITDTKGNFVLENVPTGKDIPLVIQVGKWRRQITIPNVNACADNPIEADKLRLPRNKSEGDIPKIAITTGGADPLECLLRKVGVDDTEFGVKGGAERIHLYAGYAGGTQLASGTSYATQAELWPDAATLKRYDILLLACEGAGDGTIGPDKPASSRDAMRDYMNAGGRVFMSHLHKYWLVNGPAPLPTVATFVNEPDLPNPTTALIDTSFPKGAALSEWMVNVGGSPTKPGEFVLNAGQHTVDAVNTATSQRWVYGTAGPSVMYFTFNTPVGVKAEEQCGRVVFSDIHVSSGDEVGAAFPTGCKTMDLSAQEKALEFMLFDLSSCVNPDKERPKPPK